MPVHFDFPDYYRLVPEEYLRPRLAKTSALCRREGLAGCLFTFRTDLYYLSGTMQQGAVFISDQDEVRVFIRRHPGRAQAESPLEITPIDGLGQAAAELTRFLPQGSRLGLALDMTTALDYLGWQKRLAGVRLVDISRAWQDLKAVKDEWELAALGRAGELAARVYREIPGLLAPGLSEARAAGEILSRLMAGGSTSLLRSRNLGMDQFNTQLSAGAKGAWPTLIDTPFNGIGLGPSFPFGASLSPLRENEPIIVDMGACLDGYMVDLTRTYCLGEPPAEVTAAHRCLEQVEAALCQGLRPGALSGELFDLAMDRAAKLGFADSFLGRGGHRVKFVGHGVGLELGAPPYLLAGSREKIRANEVYALELKIVLDCGPVGLENTVVAADHGPARVITPAPLGL